MTTSTTVIETHTGLTRQTADIEPRDWIVIGRAPTHAVATGEEEEDSGEYHLGLPKEGTGEGLGEIEETEKEWVTAAGTEVSQVRTVRQEYVINPTRAFAGFLVFGAAFLLSTVAYVSGRLGTPILLPLPLSLFTMIGSAGLLGTAAVGLWDAIRTRSN